MCFRRSAVSLDHDMRLNHARHETTPLTLIPPQTKRYWMKNQDVMTRWGDLRRRQLTFSHGRNKNHDGLHRGQQH